MAVISHKRYSFSPFAGDDRQHEHLSFCVFLCFALLHWKGGYELYVRVRQVAGVFNHPSATPSHISRAFLYIFSCFGIWAPVCCYTYTINPLSPSPSPSSPTLGFGLGYPHKS